MMKASLLFARGTLSTIVELGQIYKRHNENWDYQSMEMFIDRNYDAFRKFYEEHESLQTHEAAELWYLCNFPVG